MSEFVEENDLVILGDRQEAQQYAVDLNVSCMVVCNGAPHLNRDFEAGGEKGNCDHFFSS